MNRTVLRLAMALAIPLLSTLPASAQPKKAATPDEAITLLAAAFKEGNLTDVGDLTTGTAGDALRKLAKPMADAKTASDAFDAAMKAKNIDLKNPFAAALSPIGEVEYTRIATEGLRKKDSEEVYFARIKYGAAGRAQEEDVEIKLEGSDWRVSPPAELARQLRVYAPGKDGKENPYLTSQIKALEKLATILKEVAGDVEKGNVAKREKVLLSLADKIKREKLDEILKGVSP